MFIAQILILVSLLGIGVIILRKIPALLSLPEKPKEILPSQPFFSRLKRKIKGWQYSEYRGKILAWLEKLLRKTRLLFLKIDSFFLAGIEKARERSQLWKVKSRAWVEHKRQKKIKKLEALQKIEKAELIDKLKETKKGDQAEIGVEHLAKKEKELIKTISQNPKDPELYKELGSVYLEAKNFKDAQQAFEEAFKINPNDLEAKENLEKIKILREPEG